MTWAWPVWCGRAGVVLVATAVLAGVVVGAASVGGSGIHQLTQDDTLHHPRSPWYRHARARRLASPPSRDSEPAGDTGEVVGFLRHANASSPSGELNTTRGGGAKTEDRREARRRGKSRENVLLSAGEDRSYNTFIDGRKLRKRSSRMEKCAIEPPKVKRPGDPDTDDRVIDVAVIVPCNESHQYSRMKVLPVVELAVRYLEENGLRGPLENYTIKVRYRDSRLSSTYGPLAAVDLFFNNSAGKWMVLLHVHVLTQWRACVA
ncbi:uncharacterized protein LOC135089876 [Scylla paramamosain]|uniref:uncharacterized protein LOC135089876 n=1 Tax=Scylla paramamosain TaxID=85552 RepID=UPI003082DC5D